MSPAAWYVLGAMSVRPNRCARRRRLLWGAVFLALLVGAGLSGLRVNLTPSEPIGVWRLHRGAPHVGEFVTLCPPLTRPYPFLEHGTCPGGVMPFLKEIVAGPGARIRETVHGVAVNGHRLPDSAPLRIAPGTGTVLPRRFGTGRLPRHAYWTYGAGDPRWSFDSRYFGPVPRRDLRRVATPVWVWKGGHG
ncbi:MAG: S26 family signal peptidase [Acidiferrobacterales bacterium]